MPSSLGPAEIVVILIVALIVLGPKRLPDAGRQVGRALSEVRRWSTDVRTEIRSAVEPEPPGFPPPAPEPPPGRPVDEPQAPSSPEPVDNPLQTTAPAPADPSELPGAEPPK